MLQAFPSFSLWPLIIRAICFLTVEVSSLCHYAKCHFSCQPLDGKRSRKWCFFLPVLMALKKSLSYHRVVNDFIPSFHFPGRGEGIIICFVDGTKLGEQKINAFQNNLDELGNMVLKVMEWDLFNREIQSSSLWKPTSDPQFLEWGMLGVSMKCEKYLGIRGDCKLNMRRHMTWLQKMECSLGCINKSIISRSWEVIFLPKNHHFPCS